MTPQEIKSGMTQGAWSIKENAFEDDQVYDSNDKAIFNVTGEETTTAEDYANQYAICLAVNNTFGQNINPEKVPEMYALFVSIHEALSSSDFKGNEGYYQSRITDILNSTKL